MPPTVYKVIITFTDTNRERKTFTNTYNVWYRSDAKHEAIDHLEDNYPEYIEIHSIEVFLVED